MTKLRCLKGGIRKVSYVLNDSGFKETILVILVILGFFVCLNNGNKEKENQRTFKN